MRRGLLLLLFGLFLSWGVATTSPVRAADTNGLELLPFTCDPTKGTYKPVETVVFVPLDKQLWSASQIPEEIHKNTFFEFIYVRSGKTSPFNAILVSGTLYYQACSYIDYATSVATGLKNGAFVVGVVGDVPASFQATIDTIKVRTFKEATLMVKTDSEGTTFQLANMVDCTAFCKAIKPAAGDWRSREYKVSVANVLSNDSVGQKDNLSVKLTVKNEGIYPIYGDTDQSLVVTLSKSGLSQFYDSSWASPQQATKLTGVLLPGAESLLQFQMRTPLTPGKYEEQFEVRLAGKKQADPFTVKFSVKDDTYKLGAIKSKDGAIYANVRETPSLTGNVAFKLDVGEVVILREYKDLWIRIETKEGRQGWVYRQVLREIN